MHWIKATAPNGKDNWINLDRVANILPGDDGGSILFLDALAVAPDGKTRYLTTAATEAPEDLLSMMPFDPSAAPKKPVAPKPTAKKRSK